MRDILFLLEIFIHTLSWHNYECETANCITDFPGKIGQQRESTATKRVLITSPFFQTLHSSFMFFTLRQTQNT